MDDARSEFRRMSYESQQRHPWVYLVLYTVDLIDCFGNWGIEHLTTVAPIYCSELDPHGPWTITRETDIVSTPTVDIYIALIRNPPSGS